MNAAQVRLREQLRAASEALARASAGHGGARAGFSSGQVSEVTQALLQAARKHMAVANAAALEGLDGIGLPGLPGSQLGQSGASVREGTVALVAVWVALGEIATLHADAVAAIAAYRGALELSPDDVTANAQLADLFESRHDVVAAKAHAARALRADPANLTAGLALARSLLREENFAEAERVALAATKAKPAIPDEHALAWTLAGEARDRLDNTHGAFAAFTQANQLMRQRYGEMQMLSHPAHPNNVRALTQFVLRSSAATWRAPEGLATPAPAFLIGFPRSGTTLIEQVLSSHHDIFCLGETDHLFEAMSVVLRDGDLFERVSTLTPQEIETVRQAYWRVVLRDHPEANGKLVVDKHPLHIVLLPLIHKIFPNAKIVLTDRDPRDVVLSCYQQCFGVNVATAQFWDLRRTAEYFDAVMELMTVCREKLRLDWLDVPYRDVVANFETEARKLAAFLNVPFDPAMLRYDETARTRKITSASARQVINPIYGRSVQRWRRYSRELAPVLPALNEWARRLGYES